MKNSKFKILLWVLVPILAINVSCQNTFPKPVGHVSDFEKRFTRQQINYLDSLLEDFENNTAIQIAIVTIDTSMTKKAEFANYTLKLANEWGVGQKEKNEGILIGISNSYRTIRIQNSYGIEKILSDSETKVIIDSSFIPEFKKGNIYDGTLSGLKKIIEKLKKSS